ncbi:MAG: hypothetical protein KJZ47_15360 [Gemmatimonadales bacterium]|nr:hypothetical protein [Gemmatimonadales bacterium]
MTTNTLALLGDSILDNGPYTRPEPDTTAHLQRLLPGWTMQRVAEDGGIMSEVAGQLRQLAVRPSLAVLSIGGNDAVQHLGVLEGRTTHSANMLEELLAITTEFGAQYEAVARAVAAHAERVVLCTIYEVQLEPARYAELVKVPLGLLNDQVLRVGSRLGLEVLELRSVCTEPADFVQQIEPSARGAEKIARAIAAVARGGTGLATCRVYATGIDSADGA